MTPHKHHDVIVAYAKGAKIQWYNTDPYEGKGWEDIITPSFTERHLYRMKPEPKPDVVRYTSADLVNGMYSLTSVKLKDSNIQLVFDGETNKLNSVELIEECVCG